MKNKVGYFHSSTISFSFPLQQQYLNASTGIPSPSGTENGKARQRKQRIAVRKVKTTFQEVNAGGAQGL